jgi:hypothetical protein
MSFDIFLCSCNLGTRTMRVQNPFTGEWLTGFDDPGPTPEEHRAVANLLELLQAKGPEEGVYSLSFADGGEADVYGPDPASDSDRDSYSVTTRNLTPAVVELLFHLSRVGNLLIMPAAEGIGDLVTSQEQLRRVITRYPDAKLVNSVAELEKELRRGFNVWRDYRDQVVRPGE